MIITIQGKQGEGKTSLAKKIYENRKAVFINVRDIFARFGFMSVENDTEFIIVDDIKRKDFEKVYSVFTENNIKIERRGEKSFSIKTPNVILIRY